MFTTDHHTKGPTFEHQLVFLSRVATMFVFVVDGGLQQYALVGTETESLRPHDWYKWIHNPADISSDEHS